MSRSSDRVPGLTACSLCSGETLGDRDPAPGGQPGRLGAIEEAGEAQLAFVECLDECGRGDVVVARPGAGSRRLGGPVWFAGLAGDGATDAFRDWLRAGGPGRAPLPGLLEVLRFDRHTSAGA